MYSFTAVSQDGEVFPKILKVPIGGIATFTCSHDGPVVWMFKEIVVEPHVLNANGHIVTLNNVKLHNAGTYECLSYITITVPIFIAQGELKVIGEFCHKCPQ